MKTFINFTPKKGYTIREMLSDILYDNELFKYLAHMEGKPLRMDLRPQVKSGSKQAMFDYYHGALLPVAIKAYTDAGYELMDEVKVDYMLKAEFAKGTMTTPNGEEVYLLDKSKMTKERLTKFISDCILHLEMNLSVPSENIPNAEEYKSLVKYGVAFRSVKNSKNG